MTNRPAAPQLQMRPRGNPAAAPETIRLRGGPIADGTQVHLGWNGNTIVTLNLTGVRDQYLNELLAAVLEAGHNAIAEQEAAAS